MVGRSIREIVWARLGRDFDATLTEILDLVLYLGYRKVAPVGEFQLTKPRQTPLRPSELRDQ